MEIITSYYVTYKGLPAILNVASDIFSLKYILTYCKSDGNLTMDTITEEAAIDLCNSVMFLKQRADAVNINAVNTHPLDFRPRYEADKKELQAKECLKPVWHKDM